MSDDLISRSAVIEGINELIKSLYANNKEFGFELVFARREAMEMVKSLCVNGLPVAYDVDKVVERLERDSQNIELIYPTDQGYDYEDAIGIDINKAKEIVKSGGMEYGPLVCEVNKILEQLHTAGGCDASTEYAKGWDDAMEEAERIVKAGGYKI